MAKNVLVTETLSEQMIKMGAKLVEDLDSTQSSVKSAFWLFNSDEKIWKLFIASSLVRSEGPRKFYQRIVDANEKEVDSGEKEILSLNDIAVTNTDQTVVQLIGSAIKTGDGIAETRFSRNTINGVFIEDSYIYRSNA